MYFFEVIEILILYSEKNSQDLEKIQNLVKKFPKIENLNSNEKIVYVSLLHELGLKTEIGRDVADEFCQSTSNVC